MAGATHTYWGESGQSDVSQAEDVQDEVYIITPVDAPIAAMSRTIRATGKIHSWQEDSLNAAATNAQVEGVVASGDSQNPTVERTNWTQIMHKVAKVTGTLESVDKYGRASEMAYQLELRYAELANDEEFAICGSGLQAGTAGAVATARQMRCLTAQLDASVKKDAVGLTAKTDLENKLLDAHEACYTAGGNPSYLFVSPSRARSLTLLSRASGRTRELRNDRTLVNVIDLYVSDFGELDVILDRNLNSTDWIGLDPMFAATPVLRPTRDWAIAKTGDFDQRQILRESTFAVLNSKAHFAVVNVPAASVLTGA